MKGILPFSITTVSISDTKHNDTLLNDTMRNDIQHNDAPRNDSHHNASQHVGPTCDTQLHNPFILCYAYIGSVSLSFASLD